MSNKETEPKKEAEAGKENRVSLQDLPVEKGDSFRSVYSNYVAASVTPDDIRLVFCRVAIHGKNDSKVYQEVDVYLTPRHALHLMALIGRKVADWKRDFHGEWKAIDEFAIDDLIPPEADNPKS